MKTNSSLGILGCAMFIICLSSETVFSQYLKSSNDSHILSKSISLYYYFLILPHWFQCLFLEKKHGKFWLLLCIRYFCLNFIVLIIKQSLRIDRRWWILCFWILFFLGSHWKPTLLEVVLYILLCINQLKGHLCIFLLNKLSTGPQK